MNRIAMLLAAVSAAALISTAAEAKTVRWSAPTDIATLDPFAQTESFTTSMLHHVFDPLVRRGRTMQLEPALATSWKTVKPDTWRFELRKGGKFHNGNAFTADDVVASVTRLLDPGARARGNLSQVIRAEKVDDFTVDLVTKGPYPLLLNDLAGIYIMDKEWMEQTGSLKPGNIATGVRTAPRPVAHHTVRMGPLPGEVWIIRTWQRLPEPVPFELPSERPANIASITCWAPANLSASTFRPASLK